MADAPFVLIYDRHTSKSASEGLVWRNQVNRAGAAGSLSRIYARGLSLVITIILISSRLKVLNSPGLNPPVDLNTEVKPGAEFLAAEISEPKLTSSHGFLVFCFAAPPPSLASSPSRGFAMM